MAEPAVTPLATAWVIDPARVFKLTGEDAYLIDMRVSGTVEIAGHVYQYTDVLCYKFTRITHDGRGTPA